MFKHLVLLSTLAICLVACNSKKADTAQTDETVYKVESLLTVADKQVDNNILIRGHVTHVCKHSGKKCFITDDNGKESIRIEATGDITAFDQELVGSTIEVKGTLKERRLTKEEIDGMEKNATDKLESEEVTAEQCETELSNINDMRKWMTEHNKDHYAIYYINGLAYEVVD